MLPQAGFTPRSIPKPPALDTDAVSVLVVAAFMFRLARHEQDGLTPTCAVLAAGSDMGIDPALVLQAGQGA